MATTIKMLDPVLKINGKEIPCVLNSFKFSFGRELALVDFETYVTGEMHELIGVNKFEKKISLAINDDEIYFFDGVVSTLDIYYDDGMPLARVVIVEKDVSVALRFRPNIEDIENGE